VKSESAQITLDYIAGIGIFLLAVFFVFQFVYGLFIPFQSGSDKATLSADRAATMLVEQMLHSDSSGGLNVIDQSKLYYFNNTQLNYSNKANYKNTTMQLGLFSSQTAFDLNVSVADLNGFVMYQSGPALQDNTDVGQTKRLVLIINSSTGYNRNATLSVRVW
jgi:hypothetical protein